MKAILVFPHQLFKEHPGLAQLPDLIAISEDPLFFGDDRYPARFHRQKLMLHRASMQYQAAMLESQGSTVDYFEYTSGNSATNKVIKALRVKGVSSLWVCDVHDYILAKRIKQACHDAAINLHWMESPGFVNSDEQNQEYRARKKRWYMADFYKWQRRRMHVLLNDNGEPTGGKWSFDEDNRKKLPKKQLPDLPVVNFPTHSQYTTEARKYIHINFPNPIGNDSELIYPATHSDAEQWLGDFLNKKFDRFGPYEDAIVEDQNWLYHSILTPVLNTGLLTPGQILQKTLEYAEKHNTPIASVEGFVRQLIGWREFMRATYVDIGVTMRTGNHWQHNNPMPDAFYTGTTDVLPVDNAIGRVLATGYCHHIERLMVLGGFMFLCEINPDDIYLWFMELFIDSYDWVMVPNVYAMSQNADGGLITTKPYFCGSNYIRKMSHYPVGEWCEIWDALYWRWIFKQSKKLAKNPRWAMMVRNGEKMEADRKNKLLRTAEEYLQKLHE